MPELELGLGRRHAPDPRDGTYLMRAAIPPQTTKTRRFWWAGGAWLDQGATSTCVGHAWAHWVEDGPVTHPGDIDPFAIYREATALDEWSQNDNGDIHFGTSVRAAAKALRARTVISSYLWAWDADTVVRALLETGPVVVGTNWYRSMFAPDEDGVLSLDGPVVGGHAYLLNGVNTTRGLVRIKNSWSRGWAKRGHAYLRIEDLDRLIREDGEACLAVEAPS